MAERDLLLVFSNPKPGQDEAYNDWYDQIHLAEILAVPGVASGRRYEFHRVETPGTEERPAHRHLALYELDRDPREVMAECARRTASGEIGMHESLDAGAMSVAVWRARGPLQEGT
ncbi:hypothetical protein [Actinocorallia libanotica]|uniref:EthD domain-containing protein n=1 Tax=Actinocorallia libanotica TaxID=46162 RepID=A0ABP4B084_9ACTN